MEELYEILAKELKKVFFEYISGEDNSWRCEHNLETILNQIKNKNNGE